MAAAVILNLKISIFDHVTVIGFNIWCSVPNFIKIGPFCTDIWQFNDIQNGGRPPCWILKMSCSPCRPASSYKISLRSDNRSMSYGQKIDFQDGGRCHLEFKISFGHVTVIGFNICYSVPILSKSHDFSLRYGDLAIFKMPPVRHLGFVMTSQYCIAGHIFFVQILSWNFLLIGVVVSEILAMWRFWLYITDHGNFGVARALYLVTLSRRVQNNHLYEIFDPYLPIHYATFMRVRWRLKGVLRGASPLLNNF